MIRTLRPRMGCGKAKTCCASCMGENPDDGSFAAFLQANPTLNAQLIAAQEADPAGTDAYVPGYVPAPTPAPTPAASTTPLLIGAGILAAVFLAMQSGGRRR